MELNTSLTNKVDDSKLKIQNGTATTSSAIAPNTRTWLTIPFTTPYKTTPMVSVSTSYYGAFMKPIADVTVSRTEIKLTVEHTHSANLQIGVFWSAIGIID